MADATIAQKDRSRFQVNSYGWRGIDIGTDRAIYLLEQAFQSAIAIEGISSTLRSGIGSGDPEEDIYNANQIDKLLAAIEQLSTSLANEVCGYASNIEKKIEEKNRKQGAAQ